MDIRTYNDRLESARFNSSAEMSQVLARTSFWEKRRSTQEWCRDNYPSLNPKHFSSRNKEIKNCMHVAEARAEADTSQEDKIRLELRNSSLSGRCSIKTSESTVCLPSQTQFVYSKATSHKSLELSSFSKFDYAEPFSLSVDDKSTVKKDVLLM